MSRTSFLACHVGVLMYILIGTVDGMAAKPNITISSETKMESDSPVQNISQFSSRFKYMPYLKPGPSPTITETQLKAISKSFILLSHQNPNGSTKMDHVENMKTPQYSQDKGNLSSYAKDNFKKKDVHDSLIAVSSTSSTENIILHSSVMSISDEPRLNSHVFTVHPPERSSETPPSAGYDVDASYNTSLILSSNVHQSYLSSTPFPQISTWIPFFQSPSNISSASTSTSFMYQSVNTSVHDYQETHLEKPVKAPENINLSANNSGILKREQKHLFKDNNDNMNPYNGKYKKDKIKSNQKSNSQIDNHWANDVLMADKVQFYKAISDSFRMNHSLNKQHRLGNKSRNYKNVFTKNRNLNSSSKQSEIVSLKSKPITFLKMLKLAQQSVGFEDPFKVSSYFHDVFATDSSTDLGGREKKFYTSSFHGDTQKTKYYIEEADPQNQYNYLSLAIDKDENNTLTNIDSSDIIIDNTSGLDKDVLEVAAELRKIHKPLNNELNIYEQSKTIENESFDDQQNLIYEEITKNLHIDSSIDDIKDESEIPEKSSEISDNFLPPINISQVNKLEPPYVESLDNDIHIVNLNPNLSTLSSVYENSSTSIPDDETVATTLANTETTPVLALKIKNSSQTSPTSLYITKPSNNTKMTKDDVLPLKSKYNNFRETNKSTSNSTDKQSESKNTEITTDNKGKTENKGFYPFFWHQDKWEPEKDNIKKQKISLEDYNRKILDKQGERMSKLMNTSAGPCHDFYEFACGRWSQQFPLQDKAIDNNFDRLREGLDWVLKGILEVAISDKDATSTKVAKILYRGCMDEDKINALGVAPLKSLLKDLGGWPLLEGDSWNGHEAFDWVSLMAKLRGFNNDILLSEWVGADVANSSYRVIQIDQPELGLPSREYFLSRGDKKYRMAYVELMLRASEILGTSHPEKAFEDILNILQFEKQLAKILTPAEERRNLTAVHRRLTVRELQKQIPQINWNKYFEIVIGTKDNDERQIIIYGMEYIERLVNLINNTSSRTVCNYMIWRFVKNRLNNLGQEALSAKQDFVQILFGSKTKPQRWLSCVSYVNGNLGYVVGALFVKKYYPESSKNDSEEISQLILESFIEAITEADWMENRTRRIAEKKVREMVRNVGYPRYILNDTYMDHIYSELNFNDSDHFGNAIKILRFHAQSAHRLIGTPVKRTEWTTTPGVVNAYYSRSKNMIMFPAGILQPPFYHPAFPRAMNFGGIGVVIGHEISHGFDDRGRQFDEYGNLRQWWTDQDVSSFYERATCMLDQYSSYKVLPAGLKINAVNTLGENIADNAGLKIAYRAYQKWKMVGDEQPVNIPNLNVTCDQLFFLNFGQIWCEQNSPEALLRKIRSGQHSPNKYRVIGTLSNSVEFSKAFNCPANSKMNVKQKCQVW